MENLILIYDTETTGLPLWEQPSESEGQPHIVQLAALLVDAGTQEVMQSLDVIVRPEGWTIPQEVTDIHGISTEQALAVGVPEALALALFLELWGGRERVAHNESFDARIVRIATKRYCPEPTIDAWKAGASRCTCRLAKEAMQVKKRPNLFEAYKSIVGLELQDQHHAMADARACMAILFALKTDQTEVPHV